MRALSPTLARRLAGGATTLCHVWRLTRADGVVLGFTDHDRDLTIEGVTYAAASGLDAAEAQTALGLAATSADVSGALTSEALSAIDLANGLYDGASVERWLVDWSDPSERVLLDVAEVGETRRTQDRFTAELRALAHRLDQERGRLYLGVCCAEFADARCGLSSAAWSIEARVREGSSASLLRLDAAGAAPDLFVAGAAVMISGGQAGARRRVRTCALADGVLECALWTPLARTPAPGETARLTAGCDKRFETCRDRFANATNFRGFPHIPGADYVVRYAAPGDGSADGGVAR